MLLNAGHTLGSKGMGILEFDVSRFLELYGCYCDWGDDSGFTSIFSSFGFPFWVIFCPCLALMLGFRDFVHLNRLRLDTCDLSIITSNRPI